MIAWNDKHWHPRQTLEKTAGILELVSLRPLRQIAVHHNRVRLKRWHDLLQCLTGLGYIMWPEVQVRNLENFRHWHRESKFTDNLMQ